MQHAFFETRKRFVGSAFLRTIDVCSAVRTGEGIADVAHYGNGNLFSQLRQYAGSIDADNAD